MELAPHVGNPRSAPVYEVKTDTTLKPSERGKWSADFEPHPNFKHVDVFLSLDIMIYEEG